MYKKQSRTIRSYSLGFVKEDRIPVLPVWLNLDTFSVIRFSSFIVSLYIAVFLFGQKGRSVPTVLLAWAFVGAAILNLSTFLEFACPYYWQPYNLKNLLIPFSQVLGPCIGAVSLLLFSYHFPHFQKPDKKEYRAVLLLCVSANLGVVLLAYYNFILLGRGRSDFGFEQTFYIIFYVVLAVQFTLAIFLLLRKTVRFSGGRSRPWWLRLLKSRGPDAMAARSIALVLLLLVVALGGYVLMTVGVIQFHIATYLIWLVFLLFYFSFFVNYLNHTVERTTFQVKLIGLALVFIIGILGLVSIFVGKSFEQDYRNEHLIAEGQTIYFEPNRFASYTISTVPYRFATDLGMKLDIGYEEANLIELGFTFPFYEKSFEKVRVLHGPMIYLGEELREDGWGGYHPQPAIAPLLTNLDPEQGGGIFYKGESDRATITWHELPEHGGREVNSIQLAIHQDGSFYISYEELNIHSGYSAIKMYAFTTANLTGRHPGASGPPLPSGPKLIGIHPGAADAALDPIRFSRQLPYVGKRPAVIFEAYDIDFSRYLHTRMSALVLILIASSLLILFIFPFLLRTSLIQPLRALHRGMERADGGDLEVFITPQFNDEIGALTGYFNRMLQSINKAEANFRALSDNAEDGILIIEEQGPTVYANRKAGEITGYSVTKLLQLPFQKLLHSHTLQKKEDLLWQEYATHQETSHVETTVTASSGDEVPVELTVSRTIWHGIPAYVVILRDIRARKRIEEQTMRDQQRLIQTDKLTTLGILAADVAHDISNPNQTILSDAELLNQTWIQIHPVLEQYFKQSDQFLIAGKQQEELIGSVSRWLSTITANSKRIDEIVKGLKSYIRNEPLLMSSVNLNTIVRSSVELMANHLKRATENFTLQLEENIPPIRGNAQRVEQVVVNLLLNSCQSLADRRKAIIVCTSHDAKKRAVSLSVRDEGCGIPEEHLDEIKNPFFTTKSEMYGIGLGLHIADTIVKEHRGTLNFLSKPGEGTEAVVRFPAESDR